MKYDYVEKQLEQYRAKQRAERNEELTRRLAKPRTTEEMLRAFRGSSEFWVRAEEYSAS